MMKVQNKEQNRKVFSTIMLIVKDAIKLTVWCLIATILISVCIENGWILPGNSEQVSYEFFWKLYHNLFPLVPIIMFYRGFIGSYRVKVTTRCLPIENTAVEQAFTK